MQKNFVENDKKRRGQVRGDGIRQNTHKGQVRAENVRDGQGNAKNIKNRLSKGVRTGQVRNDRSPRVERINGEPIYTAIYKVNRSDELLEFLLRKCNTSRNNVKSFLARRQVLVNGSVVTQYNFMLAKDDEVKLSKRPVKEGTVPTAAKQNARAAGKTVSAKQRFEMKIVYEDDDFIAIDKPAGLLSVESDTETESAFSHVFEYLQKKDKNSRPFILHRIDKETSGVLVFAKNIKLHSMLRLHWNELVSVREYYAVVEGTLENKSDTVVSYLKENKNNMMYSTNDPTGQKAVTNYEVVKENAQYSLLRVKIDTGRKNQIRVHMQLLGHPIVGDDKYGFTKDPFGRLGLHASRLEFQHPVTHEILNFNATLPPSFRGIF